MAENRYKRAEKVFPISLGPSGRRFEPCHSDHKSTVISIDIIIDTPPINTVADAQIVSTYVDGVVLVVKSGDTTEDELNEAIDAVRRAGGNLCGTVLNDLNMKSVKYAYKYKYGGKYGYKYSYSESYEAR